VKIVVRKKAKELPDPTWIGNSIEKDAHANAEHNWMVSQLKDESKWLVNQAYTKMFQEEPADAPQWIVELACEYGALILGHKRRGTFPTATEYRRYRLCRALDVVAMRAESDIYKYMECNLTNSQGGNTMSKATSSKKSSRVTASSVLIPILSRANVPANAEIIDAVGSATGSKKFDAKQLAWYMWKFRQGKLKGMDGKQHVINQKSGRKAAVKKAKVVVRKKAA
jgi:hypothetical protein